MKIHTIPTKTPETIKPGDKVLYVSWGIEKEATVRSVGRAPNYVLTLTTGRFLFPCPVDPVCGVTA